jgi:uncharacterized protein YegL
MNMGTFHYKRSLKLVTGTVERKHAVEMALSLFYYALTICDRVHRSVQTQCLFTLAEIYKTEYSQEGPTAVRKLCEMYPQFAKEITSIGAGTNISFLIDVSSSMVGERIDATAHVLREIVNNKLKFGDKLSMDSFAKELKHVVSPVTLDSSTIDVVNSSINKLVTNCVPGVVEGTYCYKALLDVAYRLVSSNPDGPHVVVMLTDGQDNERVTTAARVKGYFVEHNIRLVIVSVGVEEPSVVDSLRYLATSTELYVKANADPESIAAAVTRGVELAVAGGNVVMEVL